MKWFIGIRDNIDYEMINFSIDFFFFISIRWILLLYRCERNVLFMSGANSHVTGTCHHNGQSKVELDYLI